MNEDKFVKLDTVLSYPIIANMYDGLRFTDDIRDEERIKEAAWIIHEMNKFITGLERECKRKTPEQIVDIAQRKLAIDRYSPAGRKELVFAMYKREMLQALATENIEQVIYEYQEGEEDE
jgi:hypothetical protein